MGSLLGRRSGLAKYPRAPLAMICMRSSQRTRGTAYRSTSCAAPSTRPWTGFPPRPSSDRPHPPTLTSSSSGWPKRGRGLYVLGIPVPGVVGGAGVLLPGVVPVAGGPVTVNRKLNESPGAKDVQTIVYVPAVLGVYVS